MLPLTRRSSSPDHTLGSTIIAQSGNSPPAFAFVTHTGPPSRSPGTQKLIRSHVMHQVVKARRQGQPVKVPVLEFALEVPDEPFWDEASLQPSQDQFLNQPMVERVGDVLDQSASGLASSSNVVTYLVLNQHSVRPSPGIIPYPQDPSQVRNNDSSENERHQNGEAVAGIERIWVGRSDPFARYPVNMNFRAHELIDHIFDDRTTNFKPFRDAWFPVGLMDPAAFHQVLANSALNISLLRNTDRAPESYEAISHHTYAVKLVNGRLSDPTFATSDEVIGAVTAFICYYHIIGNITSWQLHMNGIKEIVRLRGGPDSPTFHPFVRLTLSVADIGGSTTQDIPPTFPLPSFVPPSPAYRTPPFHPFLTAHTSLRWRTLLPTTHHAIIAILDDLSRLTSFLKAESRATDGGAYQDVAFASTHVNPLLHRLLCLVPGTARRESETAHGPDVLQEGARLAGILYLAEIRRRFGILPVVSTVQVSKLHSLLERSSSQPDIWMCFPSLHLWVLAMGVVESHADSDERVRFCERFAEAARAGRGSGRGTGGGMERGMETRRGVVEAVVEKVVRRFLWIDELHGVMFSRNWQERV